MSGEGRRELAGSRQAGDWLARKEGMSKREQVSEGAWVLRGVEIPQAPPAPSPEPTAPPAPSRVDMAQPGHGLVAEGGSGNEAQG